MIKLPKTTEYLRVRRYHLVVTDDLVAKFQQNIAVENKVYNYIVKYLEKTYGRKHLNRSFPTTKKTKVALAKDVLIPKILKDFYSLDKWDGKRVGIHSQALRDEFLVSLLTNFGEYRKVLKKSAKMSAEDKENYRKNVHGNNRKHKSWYRKGSLNYLRPWQSKRCVSLPSNGIAQVISAHHLKIQDYGVVQVVENIKNMKSAKIVTTKIKRKADGTFEIQVVFKTVKNRKKASRMVGADWNMKDNKAWHTSDDHEIYIDSKVSEKADALEKKIDQLKSQRDQLTWLSKKSKRIANYNKQIQHLYQKRKHILTDEYTRLAKEIIGQYDLVAIEKLDAIEMRRESFELNKEQNKAKNRKLAKIKPYEMSQLLKQWANRLGRTLIMVDSYKTSQVEFGTKHEEKHDITEREWVSKYTSKLIKRDFNASKNILDWAINPTHHVKYKESLARKRAGKIKKAIPATKLIEVN
ncbi:transposase [Ligilactobacillus equi]|uniref:transposase n=1 Tax=Ligilactobacillus equi TaxID=137357 RepID=UPI002ED603E4